MKTGLPAKVGELSSSPKKFLDEVMRGSKKGRLGLGRLVMVGHVDVDSKLEGMLVVWTFSKLPEAGVLMLDVVVDKVMVGGVLPSGRLPASLLGVRNIDIVPLCLCQLQLRVWSAANDNDHDRSKSKSKTKKKRR